MRFPGSLALAALGGILLYALGAEVAALPPRTAAPPGTARVSFGDLGRTSLPAAPDQARHGAFLAAVPERIRQLEDHRVVIEGFMIPTRTERDRVRSFLLVRSQASCCFGLPPQLGDVLEVRMTGAPAEVLMDRTVAVIGTFHVQERWAGPYLSSLFQMDADRVTSRGPSSPMLMARGRE